MLRLPIRRTAHRLLPLLAALSLAAPTHAAPVTLNLMDADINTLVAAIAQITGKAFIVDPRVQAKVSVISAKPVDDKDVYDVFLAVLAVHGFAAVPGDKVIKIVPAAEAKQETVPTVDRAGTAPGEQVVTRVVQLRNSQAAELVPLVRPLVPPQGHLVAHPGSNSIIVSDRAANVERIAELIARLDVPSRGEVELVPLRHAVASDVVRLIEGLQPKGPEAAGAPRALADARANAVLLTGERQARARLRALVASLDTPGQGGGSTQVVFLRYAKAKDLAQVLGNLGKKLEEAGKGAAAGGAAPAPGGGSVHVEADEASNALVISAPPEAMASLRQVVAQLDVRRAQVLVEAVIAELSAERSAQLGVQWVIDGSEGGGVIGLVNFNNTLATLGQSFQERQIPPSLPTGAQLGLGATTGAVRFGALISALASDSGTNVLSTPSLVTLDNEEAEIVVGQNVPFVTGSFTTSVAGGTDGGIGGGGGGLTGNPFQTIQRQDVGLTLKVKPQINEGNAVKLEINQEVSSVASVSQTQGPTTNKRALKTSVLVEDGQLLVLGGLIDDNLEETEDKVPGLGDVPLLGELFKFRSTKKVKRNLMVFLHPVILRDGMASTFATSDKYAYIREQQAQARTRSAALLPGVDKPVAPSEAEIAASGSALNLGQRLPPAPDLGRDDAALRLRGFLRLEF